ncbi:MAG: hypothetical protein K0S06_3690 [Microvirga sp.]|nr:hypothetical protein [Microvirga sp.]
MMMIGIIRGKADNFAASVNCRKVARGLKTPTGPKKWL